MTPPTAATRLACLLGHPVTHSVSPQIHNAAFAAANVDAAYLAFDVAPGDLAAAVAGLRALGFLGANVTVPHKRAALALADAATAEAEAVGAANTLFWDGDRLVADNTDVGALRTVLERDVGVTPGLGALVFGAGGAARAAAVALGRLGARVAVVARRPQAARDVATLACRWGAGGAGAGRPALVVNATPLGLHGEALPGMFMTLGEGQVALDLTYGAGESPFVAAARRGGAHAFDGVGMLVEQAAAAFQRWTGGPAPLAVMADAAAAALGR